MFKTDNRDKEWLKVILLEKYAKTLFSGKNLRHKNCFIIRVMNVISLQTYKQSKLKKDQTWLYSISYDELFSEFIDTFNKFEIDPQNESIHIWLDEVSDALNQRFYNQKPKENL